MDSMSQRSSIMKLQISSAKLKQLQKSPPAIAQAPSTPLRTPSSLTPTAIDPRNVHKSAMQRFTSTFRMKEDLVRENIDFKAQLAEAQEQLASVAQAQEHHEQDVAQLLETIDRRDRQLARVQKLNSDAKVIVQEMAQMATDTARQAQEVAQAMTNMAHRAQNLVYTNNDDDDD